LSIDAGAFATSSFTSTTKRLPRDGRGQLHHECVARRQRRQNDTECNIIACA
jgi:hypothetical protein